MSFYINIDLIEGLRYNLILYKIKFNSRRKYLMRYIYEEVGIQIELLNLLKI